MLKKVGTVVAAAAAGMLAVSPLALASDASVDNQNQNQNVGQTNINDQSTIQNGLVNTGDINAVSGNQLNALCNVNANIPIAAAIGILNLGLMGDGGDTAAAAGGDNTQSGGDCINAQDNSNTVGQGNENSQNQTG